jgi:hypothetical protein
MTEEQRRLLLARQTWRAMHANETEVLLSAKRIAAKFQPRKSLSFGRRVRMVSGALATVAGIAYAGSGSWADLAGKWGGRSGARSVAEDRTTATVQPRTTGPHDPREERTGVVPERLAIDQPTPPFLEPVAKPKKKIVRRIVARARVAEGVEVKELASSVDHLDASWADVNAALGSADQSRAESLLLQLADTGHDPDTRAKARLGLAQLAAARGDCDRARVLALGVAAGSGIEMKTVRRALELAVRCAK